jgi:hypothetical protein
MVIPPIFVISGWTKSIAHFSSNHQRPLGYIRFHRKQKAISPSAHPVANKSFFFFATDNNRTGERRPVFLLPSSPSGAKNHLRRQGDGWFQNEILHHEVGHSQVHNILLFLKTGRLIIIAEIKNILEGK